MNALNWPAIRQALIVLGLVGVQYFSWASHSVTLFNGLATPLFLVLSAYLLFLATQYRISVSPKSLALFLLFAAWVVFTDARSGEFMPALAMDTHWFILPIAVLLIAQVFREYPLAFQALRVGAAFCIINLLLTMYLNAEWYLHWHRPPVFGHIRHLGLSIGFLTILLFSKNEVAGWSAIFFRLSRILGLTLMFWSGTRSSILAWIGCMVIFICIDRSWTKTILIDTLLAVTLSLIPTAPHPNDGLAVTVQRSFSATSADALSASRVSMWKSALSGLETIEKIWSGLGGNGFARLQTQHQVVVTPPGHVHAHNFVVQGICDWGIIGIALFFLGFFRSSVRSIVRDRKRNNPTALAGLAYLLVTGLLDATLYHLEHLDYLAIALAYLVSQKNSEGNERMNIPPAVVAAALAGLALIHLLVLDYRIGLSWYFPTQ